VKLGGSGKNRPTIRSAEFGVKMATANMDVINMRTAIKTISTIRRARLESFGVVGLAYPNMFPRPFLILD